MAEILALGDCGMIVTKYLFGKYNTATGYRQIQ